MPEKFRGSDAESRKSSKKSTKSGSKQFFTETDKISPESLHARQMRRLSVPDMRKLKKAVALSENIGDAQIPYGKLQVSRSVHRQL